MKMKLVALLCFLVGACSTQEPAPEEATLSSVESYTYGNHYPTCEDSCGRGKVMVCKVPWGNPSNAHTICVSKSAAWAHLKKGSYCGECESTCGDQVCGTDEDCESCPSDCGECEDHEEPTCDYCGDGTCSDKESCESCPSDCGYCPPTCGDNVCDVTETCDSCSADCGQCPPTCGNNSCEDGETCASCPSDCGSCEPPPPVCGDNICNGDETCGNCPSDCGQCDSSCGNDVCEENEDCSYCPSDCGTCVTEPECGNEVCELGETCSNCASDCGSCQPSCGDYECNGQENCETCPYDCGECQTAPECTENECGYPQQPPSKTPISPQRVVTGGGCNVGGESNMGGLFLMVTLLSLMLLRRRNVLSVVLLLGLAMGVSSASAQVKGDPGEFNVERFHMPMDSSGILNVEGDQVMVQGSWGAYLALYFSDDPLVVKERFPGEEWDRVSSLVDARFGGVLGGYYAATERLRFGVGVPVVLFQDRDNSSTVGTGSLSSTELGDLQLRAKYHFVRNTPFDFSVGLDWTLPTATASSYLGENDATFTPYLIVGRKLGAFRTFLNVGFTSKTSTAVENLLVNDEVFARLGAAYRMGAHELGASLSNQSRIRDFMSKHSSYTEVMGGYTYYHKSGLSAFAGAGRGLTDGFGSPDYRVFSGLRFEFTPTPKIKPTPVPVSIPRTAVPKKKEPEPKVHEPIPVEKSVILVPRIHFILDSAKLTEHYDAKLVKFAEELKLLIEDEDMTKPLLTVGHTDAIASHKYNDALGMRRAKSVMNRLVELGIPAELIMIETKGETSPISTNKTDVGRALNRRVELTISEDLDFVKWEVKYESFQPEGTMDSLGNQDYE